MNKKVLRNSFKKFIRSSENNIVQDVDLLLILAVSNCTPRLSISPLLYGMLKQNEIITFLPIFRLAFSHISCRSVFQKLLPCCLLTQFIIQFFRGRAILLDHKHWLLQHTLAIAVKSMNDQPCAACWHAFLGTRQVIGPQLQVIFTLALKNVGKKHNNII